MSETETNRLTRIYPGVTKQQKQFIKEESKRLNKGEGETVRHILDVYISNLTI